MVLEWIRSLWPVLVGLAALVVWITRLEGRVRRIEERFAEIAAANACDHKTMKELLYAIRDVFVRKGWMGPSAIMPDVPEAHEKPGGA